jgi:predicted metal-dependent phosphoesterase TrpH
VRFELHCHSTCSDGTESPEAVAARAAGRGVAVFALTDHDTCAGSAVTVPGARVIRAVELSCDDDGRTVHVLAFDRGGAWDALDARLAVVREARRNRMRVMAAKLARRGIAIDVEPLLVAHPHLYDQRSIGYLRRYRSEGLTGIEAFYGAYDARARARWIAVADELGATCTGGSDWHGPEAPNALPGVDLPDGRSDALLAWLAG